MFVFHHLDQKRLPRRHIKSIDQPLKRAEPDNLLNIDVPGESKKCQSQRLEHCQHLGHDQNLPSIKPVNQNAGERCEEKRWYLSRESHHSQEKSRTSQTIDQPTGGQPGHPRSDQRNTLPAEI